MFLFKSLLLYVSIIQICYSSLNDELLIEMNLDHQQSPTTPTPVTNDPSLLKLEICQKYFPEFSKDFVKHKIFSYLHSTGLIQLSEMFKDTNLKQFIPVVRIESQKVANIENEDDNSVILYYFPNSRHLRPIIFLKNENKFILGAEINFNENSMICASLPESLFLSNENILLFQKQLTEHDENVITLYTNSQLNVNILYLKNDDNNSSSMKIHYGKFGIDHPEKKDWILRSNLFSDPHKKLFEFELPQDIDLFIKAQKYKKSFWFNCLKKYFNCFTYYFTKTRKFPTMIQNYFGDIEAAPEEMGDHTKELILFFYEFVIGIPALYIPVYILTVLPFEPILTDWKVFFPFLLIPSTLAYFHLVYYQFMNWKLYPQETFSVVPFLRIFKKDKWYTFLKIFCVLWCFFIPYGAMMHYAISLIPQDFE